MDKRVYENKVEIDFSRPGKPADNARCDPSMGGSVRSDRHCFLSFADAQGENRRLADVLYRGSSHSALKCQALGEYARQHLADSQNANLNGPEISDPD